MVKYEEYNPKEASNCVIRSISKLLNRNPLEIENELKELAIKMNYNDYTEIEVFEKYLEDNNFEKISITEEIQIKNLELDNNNYCIFCYDKKEFYHMVVIINNTMYDKRIETLELYPITIYKNKNLQN